MTTETALVLTSVFTWVSAVGFTAAFIAYAFYGRWRETAVGFWYLFLIGLVGLSSWVALFARYAPEAVRLWLGPVVWGLVAIGALGTAPVIVLAIMRERKRRRQHG